MGERRLRRPSYCGFVLELERPEKDPVNASQRPDIEPQDGVQHSASQCYTPGRLLSRIDSMETKRSTRCIEATLLAAYCVLDT